MAQLVAENLCQGYGRREVVREFSHSFEQGIVGLLGPNGAGKTTLLNTLALLRPPTGGQLFVDRQLIGSMAAVRSGRRNIGIQPQNFPYPGSLTVRDFLRYAAWMREFPRSQTAPAVESAIERLNLGDYATTKLRTLSGGTLQRVGVAQAIVHDPAIVILDEPTVGLDPAQRVDLRTQLRELAADRVVIVSTHIVDDVVHTCDTVLVFLDGRVTFSGTPDELSAVGGSHTDSGAMSPVEAGYLRLAGIRREVSA